MGRTGHGRTLLFTPTSGCVLTWCSLRVSLILLQEVLGFLPIRPGLMRNSEKLGFPCFCRSWQREASLEEFNEKWMGWLPLLPVVSLPELTGDMLADVVRTQGELLLGVLMVGVGGK